MKTFTVFGYKINIRKIKPSKPHPMDTKAYSQACAKKAREATAALKKEVFGYRSTKKKTPRLKRA